MRSLSRVLLACLALALLPGSGKADDNPVCRTGAIKNCSCVMSMLESRLTARQIYLLTRAWFHSRSEDAERRMRFFTEEAANILPVSLQYGEIKYFIAAKCGALAFDDD
jgi:hypothetical protein